MLSLSKMLSLNAKGWKMLDAVCSNASAVYPMKVVYENNDKTTFVLVGATAATKLFSVLVEGTPISTVATTIDNLAIIALATRIFRISGDNSSGCFPIMSTYLYSQSIVLLLSLASESYGKEFPTRILSYLFLGLYLESCSKINSLHRPR